ncbi:MAG: 1,4-dihydroxy-2-naphthoate octaprenyltransferase [Syntrophales bacterium]|jgi:1,4-dihydroxy-2-naphthoate octaprenyltransferase|nr:1,4-dihydroxy-2-naphthoate octaprenyltransferase [Syntrophales bacterium]MCK9391341.1 1,4-dihydroxy-2-naphthoate octaprenyltransferase [Syntrophales bacterium]
MNKELIRAWFQASRPPFYIATLIPLTLGWVVAGQTGPWHPWRFFLINLAAFMIHLATNLANDYFDHLQGTDAGASIGGSRVIQEHKITPETLKRVIILLYTGAFLIACYIMNVYQVWGLAPILLFSFLSSLFYVAPPIRYGYYGLGEVFVGVNMGPIMVVGTYWVIVGRPDWSPFYLSLPIGLMVASILYYQSIPDIDTDRSVGKRTLAVRLGKEKAITGLFRLWMAIYVSIITITLSGGLHSFAFLSLLSLPILFKIIRLARRTTDKKQLDSHGKYVRILYFFNGAVIIAARLLFSFLP